MVDEKVEVIPAVENDSPEFLDKKTFYQEINKIMTSYNKKLEGKFNELLNKAATTAPSTKEDKPDNKEDGRIKELTSQIDKLLQAQNEYKAQAKNERLKATVATELTKSGVDPKYIGHAFTYLKSNNAFVEDEDTGEWRMKIGGIEMPIETATKEWTKSEDSKPYLVQKTAVGSGGKESAHRPVVQAKPNNQFGSSSSQDEFPTIKTSDGQSVGKSELTQALLASLK